MHMNIFGFSEINSYAKFKIAELLKKVDEDIHKATVNCSGRAAAKDKPKAAERLLDKMKG